MKKRSMKNIYIILTGMCIAVVIIAVTMSAKINSIRNERVTENIVSESEEISENVEKKYVIKKYKQSIGIFDEEENLCDVLDVSYSMLSDEDKEMLNSGIYVENEEELRKIKEDFES